MKGAALALHVGQKLSETTKNVKKAETRLCGPREPDSDVESSCPWCYAAGEASASRVFRSDYDFCVRRGSCCVLLAVGFLWSPAQRFCLHVLLLQDAETKVSDARGC
eukprot:g189.t1